MIHVMGHYAYLIHVNTGPRSLIELRALCGPRSSVVPTLIITPSPLKFIPACRDPEPTFASLGEDRIVYIAGLYPIDPDQISLNTPHKSSAVSRVPDPLISTTNYVVALLDFHKPELDTVIATREVKTWNWRTWHELTDVHVSDWETFGLGGAEHPAYHEPIPKQRSIITIGNLNRVYVL